MSLKLNLTDGCIVSIGPNCTVTVKKVRPEARRVELLLVAPPDVHISWHDPNHRNPARRVPQQGGGA